MTSDPTDLIVKPQDIKKVHDHPLNNSVSKQQWSIPKALRFRNIKNQELNENFYDINPKFYRGKRACSLGVGERFKYKDKD